ncbi:MAG: YgcG family protein [Xanthobacteraceae bacterium]|nr:YgcG family protein [Xanthobacteraceae bacterium]
MKLARYMVLAVLLCWASLAVADIAVPPLTARVIDQTGTLTPDQTANLEQKLKDFEARKGSQIAVLIVPTTQPEDIAQYSIRVVDQWKLGRKGIDDGALLIVAKNDHRLRIEVGYGLEGALNDATSNRIISEIITPKFKEGDFAGGIGDGVDRMIGVIDGEPLPAPKPPHQRLSSDKIDELGQLFPVILILTIVLGGILRSTLGRLPGSIVTGGGVAVAAWLFIGVWTIAGLAGVMAFAFTLFGDLIFSGGNFPGGGYGGGYRRGGSDWSGGGGGGGGFSGGGGGFGGGGASGNW